MQKIMFIEKCCMQSYNFYVNAVCKQLLEKFHFNFLHGFNVFCTWNKEAVWHNIAYMVKYFLFSLEIPVMVEILYEMIKILNKKMSNGIYLHWFQNYTSQKNNLVNGQPNDPWFTISPSSKIFLAISFAIGIKHSAFHNSKFHMLFYVY